MKQFIVIGALSLFCVNGIAQVKTSLYPSGNIQCERSIKNNMLNGKYTSYYENGTKKAEGHFSNNLRKGKWTLWAETGQKILVRDYSDGYNYTIKGMWGMDGKAKDYQQPTYQNYIIAPRLGFQPYFKITEENVLASKRVWRHISIHDAVNVPLFEPYVYQAMYSAYVNGEIKAYSTSSDEFKETFSAQKFDEEYGTKVYKTALNEIKVVGYNIKEDWFYDKARGISETRLIGICPVVEVKVKKQGVKQVPLCWFYYPEVRSILATIKAKGESGYSSRVLNVENLIFYRNFYGKIYKENNVDDRTIAKEKKTPEAIAKEIDRIELEIIELEHKIWLGETL